LGREAKIGPKETPLKLSVEFPSVCYREGPAAVGRLATAIERIGYDHIDIFDHVVMGIPMEGRPPARTIPRCRFSRL